MGISTSTHPVIATPSEANLTATLLDQNQRTLLLTAATPGSGTSTCALALASQLAQMGAGPVLLVDSSCSDNNLSRQLSLDTRRGFNELMFGPHTPPAMQDCIAHVADLPFDVLPAGAFERGSARLKPELAGVLLQQLREHYRFVVIDGEAIYASADSLVIGTLVDAVILVVCAEQTRWGVAQAAAQRLSQAGAWVMGSVFNRRKYYVPKWLYDNL